MCGLTARHGSERKRTGVSHSLNPAVAKEMGTLNELLGCRSYGAIIPTRFYGAIIRAGISGQFKILSWWSISSW